jgi:hypothetical protein
LPKQRRGDGGDRKAVDMARAQHAINNMFSSCTLSGIDGGSGGGGGDSQCRLPKQRRRDGGDRKPFYMTRALHAIDEVSGIDRAFRFANTLHVA